MYDEAWQKIREESLAFTKNKEEAVLKKWLCEIGYVEPVGYYRNTFDREFVLYTTKVGYLIGKAGVNIRRFEAMLSEEYIGEWKVKVFEIRGGFVNCDTYTVEPSEIKLDAQCKSFFGKIFRVQYEKDWVGLWRRIYLFNKCVDGKLIARWEYV